MMAGTYLGRITAFEVREKSPRGLATFLTTSSSPGAPSVAVFKLDEDSDQSFAGMAQICAHQVNVNVPATNVKIEVKSGADDEIDTITAL
ncbi:MAG TPA: hypothetical protein VH796_04480 [Nitrososphaeraceae archaeon]